MSRLAGCLLLPLLVILPAGAAAAPTIDDPGVQAAVSALREDGSLKVRTQAALVLGRRRARAATPALCDALASDDAPAVRIAAAAALARIGDPAGRAALERASERDPDLSVRAAAARALAEIGFAFTIDEPSGEGGVQARAALREAITRHLERRGYAVVEHGGMTLKPSVLKVDVQERGGRTFIAVKAALVAVDGQGRMAAMLESGARLSASGAVPSLRSPPTPPGRWMRRRGRCARISRPRSRRGKPRKVMEPAAAYTAPSPPDAPASTSPPGDAAGTGAAPRRRLRNYLLDGRLQLRLAGYLLAVAFALSVGMGWLLWSAYRETSQVLALSDPELAQSLAAADRSRIVVIAAGVVLALLCILGAAVVVTHRIAGPAYVLGKTCREIAGGRIAPPRPLRARNLLVNLAGDVGAMVEALRAREAAERELLAAAAATLRDPSASSAARAAAAEALERLADEKQVRLGS